MPSEYWGLYEYSEERFKDFCLKIRDGSALSFLEEKVKTFEETCNLEEIHVDLVSEELVEKRVKILEDKLKEIELQLPSLPAKKAESLLHDRLKYLHAVKEPYKHLEIVLGGSEERRLILKNYPDISQRIFFQDRHFSDLVYKAVSFISLVDSLKKIQRDPKAVLSAKEKRNTIEQIIFHLSQGSVHGHDHDFDDILSKVYSLAHKKEEYVTLSNEQGALLTTFANALNSLDPEQKRELIKELKKIDLSLVHMLNDLVEVLKKCKENSSDTIIDSEERGWQKKKITLLTKIFDRALDEHV